jgi:hypothetical protein
MAEAKLPERFAKNPKEVFWFLTRYAYFRLRLVREN